MKVLLTGATGFVGLNIVAALCDAGHEVHALVRNRSKLDYLKTFPVTLHWGELTDEAALRTALRGLDAVIHCAGVTGCDEREYPHLREVNAEGTRAVVAACLATGVKRLVYTSTTSTIGARNSPTAFSDETAELTGFRAKNPYGRSKLEAEKHVLDGCAKGLEGIILNPAEVLGAFDYSMNWGLLVLAVCSGQVPFLPPGSGSFCCAAEVGRAHVAALTRGVVGQRYILAGTDLLFADLIAQIGAVTGASYRVPDGPYEAAYYAALLQQELSEYSGERPMVDPYRMRVFKNHFHFDSRKAQETLGYTFQPIDIMIRNAFNWYKANGFLDSAPNP